MWIYTGVYLILLLILLNGWRGERLPLYQRMGRGVQRLHHWLSRGKNRHGPAADMLILLSAAEARTDVWSRHQIKTYALLCTVILVCNTFALLVGLQQEDGLLSGERMRLARAPYGTGGYTEELLVTVPGTLEEEAMDVYVEGRKFTMEEAQAMTRQAAEQIAVLILGENQQLTEIRSDLKLLTQMPELPVTIKWRLNSYQYMDRTGRLSGEIPEEGAEIMLTAVLSCQEAEQEVRLEGQIWPVLRTEQEHLLEKIRQEIAQQNEKTKTEESLELPEEVDGQAVEWKEKQDRTDLYLLLLGAAAAFLLLKSREKNVQKQFEDRTRQMLLDYPDITGRMMLLTKAGLPVKKAWEEIVRGYQKNREKEIRYAYEEMMITCYEMQSGVPEAKAYEEFGKRCRVQQYRKFSTLLVQNLKKGAKGLADMLHTESMLALEERKAVAKRAGEEAGTRLLVPMFLMLVIVLVIVMIPAFLSIEL